MNKDIENRFFEVFTKGGVVENCIKWVRVVYNRPVKKPSNANKLCEANPEERCKQLEQLERKIWEWKEDREFDFTGGLLRDRSPLMDEIESNLKECPTDEEKEKYVFSLLKYFGEAGCNCSVVFAPAGEIKRLDYEVTRWENYKKTCPEQDIQACERMINHCIEQREWVAESFMDFETIGLDAYATGNDTPEYWFGFFQDIVKVFATRLDALLLENGMDLMKLQEDSGLYLQMTRNNGLLAKYLGSEALARRYIAKIRTNEIQTPPTDGEQGKANSNVVLPDGINKCDVKYFERAIENGFMELSVNKGKWNKEFAKLGYFCFNAYNQPRPITKLEEFFGVRNLGACITQAGYKAKRRDVEEWRNEMKSLIFFDL